MNGFSRVGFILATLGSSIGLGHIWRFPYMAGENGGGAFVLFYLILSLTIGVSILVAEMMIGNKTQANTVKTFEMLDTTSSKKWKYAGIVIIGGPLILTFYSIVLGWVFYYLFFVSFSLPSNIDEAKQIFGALAGGSFWSQLAGFTLTILLTGWTVSVGVKAGIEKLNLILMPLLFLIFIGLLLYAMSMDSFGRSFDFMFGFDVSKLTSKVMLDALGQMFFSLSIGVGTIITYAAYADKKENLLKSSVWVVISGIAVSLVAGLMIFTFLFEYGGEPNGGTGLLFMSLPVVFGKMGVIGNVISVLFLISVAFAGITSTVSILEPASAFIKDHYKISQAKASWYICIAIYVVGVVLIFSLNSQEYPYLSIAGKSLFDWIADYISVFLMALGGFLSVIFVGFVVGRQKSREFTSHFLSEGQFAVWMFIVKYIAPIIILMICIAKMIG